MKRTHFILLALVMIGAVACQKEVDYVDLGNNNGGNPSNPSNPSNQSIIGNWKFVKLNGVSTSITEFTDGGMPIRNVSTMQVDSKDEKGTQKIDETTITTNGIGYSVSTVVVGEMFVSGISSGPISLPFDFTSPLTSGSSKYKKVTADSIYVEGGLLNVDVQDPISALPVGAKISWLKDTMVLHIKTSQVQSITDPLVGKLTAIIDYKAKYVRL